MVFFNFDLQREIWQNFNVLVIFSDWQAKIHFLVISRVQVTGEGLPKFCQSWQNFHKLRRLLLKSYQRIIMAYGPVK